MGEERRDPRLHFGERLAAFGLVTLRVGPSFFAVARPSLHDLVPRQALPLAEIELPEPWFNDHVYVCIFKNGLRRFDCSPEIARICAIECFIAESKSEGSCLRTALVGKRDIAVPLKFFRSVPFRTPVTDKNDLDC